MRKTGRDPLTKKKIAVALGIWIEDRCQDSVIMLELYCKRNTLSILSLVLRWHLDWDRFLYIAVLEAVLIVLFVLLLSFYSVYGKLLSLASYLSVVLVLWFFGGFSVFFSLFILSVYDEQANH